MGSGSSLVLGEQIHMMPYQQPVYRGYPQQQVVIAAMPCPKKMQQPQPECDPIVIDEEMVEEYVRLENEIRRCEKKKPLQQLECKMAEMQKYSTEIQELEKCLEQHQTPPAACEVDAEGKDLIKEIDEINANVKPPKPASSPFKNKDALISMDVIKRKLEELQKKYDECDKELDELNNCAADLLFKYFRQDELLVSMFSKGNASQKEAELLEKLCALEAKKKRIECAKNEWKEAQMLLEYACKKLAYAVQQWQCLPEIPKICLEVRYSLSADAERAMRGSGRSLELDEEFNNLPNCSPEDLAALEALAMGCPGKVNDRYLKCMDNYSESCKRGMALIKWFRKVLNTTMYRDLVEVCEDVRLTSCQIRTERLNVLKQKLKEYSHNMEPDCKLASAADEAKKAHNENKDKAQNKKNLKPRRGSQSSINGMNKAPRKGSIGKVAIIGDPQNVGHLKNKAQVRMEKRLGQQLSDLKQRQEQRQPTPPPPTQPQPTAPPA